MYPLRSMLSSIFRCLVFFTYFWRYVNPLSSSCIVPLFGATMGQVDLPWWYPKFCHSPPPLILVRSIWWSDETQIFLHRWELPVNYLDFVKVMVCCVIGELRDLLLPLIFVTFLYTCIVTRMYRPGTGSSRRWYQIYTAAASHYSTRNPPTYQSRQYASLARTSLRSN